MKKVLGIGNALVDIMTRLESDQLLNHFNLKKGSMQLVDADLSSKINSQTIALKKEISSGGSAANTIHGLANMGVETSFIGKTGQDDFGRFFADDMRKNGIRPILFQGKSETGCAIVFISPDSERTFATYLGSAIELSADDLHPDIFAGYDFLHIEGYLVQNRKLIQKAVQLAHENGLMVSLDLASYNVVEQNIEFLDAIINKYVNIIFANEEEARAFTGNAPEEAIHLLANMCDIAIVKTGASGSLVKQNDELYTIQPVTANSIDTTGAGDLYASGFIYGLTKQLPPDNCGAIGSLLAGKVIELIGAKLNNAAWQKVHNSIKNAR
jgi:sugar/nucleoside kinase (ribokinase family)